MPLSSTEHVNRRSVFGLIAVTGGAVVRALTKPYLERLRQREAREDSPRR
ncbi:MAG: hypothetical protein ACT4P7_23540 [Gemmatimonadaceae bacterium]